MDLKLVSGLDNLLPYVSAWEDLAAAALEPNPFYEPWMLLPAARHLGAGQDLNFLLIFDHRSGAGHDRSPVLCGVVPLERQRRYNGLPITAWSLWKHRHCFLTTPLIRADAAIECLEALFGWLASDQGRCDVFEMRYIPGEGPFTQALAGHLTATGRVPLLWEYFTRAFFRPLDTADAYFSATLNAKHRKEMRRRAKLLGERGRLEYSVLDGGGDIHAWSDEFLQLEASGWKGQNGSALSNDPRDRQYFLDVMDAGFAKHRLFAASVVLDGKPIAQHSFFLGGGGAFYFKPAFDESLAKFSPGFHLECETIQHLHQTPHIRWMDTCTSADNEAFNRLFPGRRTIQTLIVPMSRGMRGFLVSTLPLLRYVKRSRGTNVTASTREPLKGHRTEA